MEINLRKASAIQAEIKKAISSVELKDTVTLSEFCPDVVGEMLSAQAEYLDNLERKQTLTRVLYNIRTSVASANGVAGIPTLLGEIEHIEAQIKLLESVVSTRAKLVTIEEIVKRLEKIRNTPADNGRSWPVDSTSSGVVSKDTIEASKLKIKQLRKQKQDMQDKLLSINVNTLITVSSGDYKILGEEGIL